VLSVARDVTDRWLAYEAEQRARFVADALREATVVLTRSLDRETVLVTLLDRLRRMVPFDRASVMLLEEASRVSVRAVFDGDRVVPLTPEARSEFDPTDHPVVHSILTTGSPLLIPDVRAHPKWSLPTDQSSEASWMGVPLFARGNVAGLFSLSKREAGYFNDEHVSGREVMSSQARYVENACCSTDAGVAADARCRAASSRCRKRAARIARSHDEWQPALVSAHHSACWSGRSTRGALPHGAELVQRTDAVIDSLHRLAVDLRPPSLDHLGL
jgi:transcriptional regulator with GAF, ATPase, and Fis domain